MTLDLAAAAADYAAAGLRIFPLWHPQDGRCACPKGAACDKPGKHPRTTNGLLDASTDAAQVTKWWTRWPDANIGMACGPSRRVALDIDVHHDGLAGLDGLIARHHVPPTLASETGNGGAHLVYAVPPGRQAQANSVRKLGAGLDVRGTGGYIILPPSLHATGRRYRWAALCPPEPAPEFLLKPAEQPKRQPVSVGRVATVGPTTPYGRAALERELAALAATRQGGRNDQLNNSALHIGQLVAGGEIDTEGAVRELLDVALAIGLPASEAKATIKSGLKGGKKNPRQAPK